MAVTVATELELGRLFETVDADGWPLLPPTLLTVHRTSAEDEGSRQIICSLDGSRLGQLLHGQRGTWEILPGKHELRFYNTLVWKTVTFEVEPGGHVHYTVWNKGWWGYAFYMMFVGPSPLFLGVARGTPDREAPHTSVAIRQATPPTQERRSHGR